MVRLVISDRWYLPEMPLFSNGSVEERPATLRSLRHHVVRDAMPSKIAPAGCPVCLTAGRAALVCHFTAVATDQSVGRERRQCEASVRTHHARVTSEIGPYAARIFGRAPASLPRFAR